MGQETEISFQSFLSSKADPELLDEYTQLFQLPSLNRPLFLGW